MPQDAGYEFFRCAMTCTSEFASAFCGAIYISRYHLLQRGGGEDIKESRQAGRPIKRVGETYAKEGWLEVMCV